MNVLSALLAESDILRLRVKVVKAYGTAARYGLAMSVKSRLEVGRGAADQVFVDSVAARMARDPEADGFTTKTVVR